MPLVSTCVQPGGTHSARACTTHCMQQTNIGFIFMLLCCAAAAAAAPRRHLAAAAAAAAENTTVGLFGVGIWKDDPTIQQKLISFNTTSGGVREITGVLQASTGVDDLSVAVDGVYVRSPAPPPPPPFCLSLPFSSCPV